jgi:hypothetical protein
MRACESPHSYVSRNSSLIWRMAIRSVGTASSAKSAGRYPQTNRHASAHPRFRHVTRRFRPPRKIGHDRSESLLTIRRNPRSRPFGIAGHDASEYAPERARPRPTGTWSRWFSVTVLRQGNEPRTTIITTTIQRWGRRCCWFQTLGVSKIPLFQSQLSLIFPQEFPDRIN